jgi:tetratricopeptide (TPR) repeat protein
LEAASVAGEEFAVAAVAAGAQRPVGEVEAVCERLAGQHRFLDGMGLAHWPDGASGGRYRFQHALYAQVLYEQLGQARRRQLHRRIGARLEAAYGARAREIAAQLAVHFEQGGETGQAVHYLRQAGENAARRHAYHEAIAAFRHGLALLAMLPDSRKRTQRELVLQLMEGEFLMATRGMAAPEAGEAFTRAYTLGQQVGETPQLFQGLRGLCRFHRAQARLRTAEALGQQLLDLAQRQRDPVWMREGHLALGGVAFYLGDLVAARAHLEQSQGLPAPIEPAILSFPRGYESEVIHGSRFALVLWLLGYADQAQQWSQKALALAEQQGDPSSLAYAVVYATLLAQFHRDVAAIQAHIEALRHALAVEDFAYRVEQGHILQGWALAMQGEAGAGLGLIHHGLVATEGTGLKLFRPYLLALLAEAHGQAAQHEAGLQVLAEALTLVAETEECWWEAELYRLQGVLLLQLPSPDVLQAEACCQQALAVARAQQAKSLELRAALSLSRLWSQQGQHDAARRLLAEVYGWFPEGFDTTDLQQARALLDDLT